MVIQQQQPLWYAFVTRPSEKKVKTYLEQMSSTTICLSAAL
jgi:hypothetical protein